MKLTGATRNAMLADLIATGGVFDPAALFLGVGTAVVDNGLDTVLADITPATGAMATRRAVTPWSPVFDMVDGRAVVNSPLFTFAPADATQNQTLAVWFLASALVAGNLIAWGPILPAATLVDATTPWSIIVRLTLDPNARWSAEIVFNG